MSLINKLLSDLENRDVQSSHDQHSALDGLYSAYNLPENERTKGLLPWLLIALALVAIFATAYHHDRFDTLLLTDRGHTEKQTAVESPESARGDLKKDKPERYVLSKEFSLKMEGLIAQDGPATAISGQVLLQKEADDLMTIDIGLDEPTRYFVYTLKDPHRVVFEIKDPDLDLILPDITAVKSITSARKRTENDDVQLLVLESSNELEIRNSESRAGDDGFHIEVLLQSLNVPNQEADEIVQIPGDDAVPESGKVIVTSGEIIKSAVKPVEMSEVDKLLIEAQKLYDQGKFALALDGFYSAVAQDPMHSNARMALAAILVEQGQQDLAASILKEGLGNKPDDTAWSRLLAQIYLNNQQFKAAEDIHSAKMPDLASNPDYHAVYAVALQKQNKHTSAAVTYQGLLKLNPQNGSWWLGLAISLEALSRHDDALFAYRTALDRKTLPPETHRYISQRIRLLIRKDNNEST